MSCQRCKSERVVAVCAKCSDCCNVDFRDKHHDGYVPGDLGIGGGDYVDISVCLDCGQLQGEWPLPKAKIEKDMIQCPHCREDFEVAK